MGGLEVLKNAFFSSIEEKTKLASLIKYLKKKKKIYIYMKSCNSFRIGNLLTQFYKFVQIIKSFSKKLKSSILEVLLCTFWLLHFNRIAIFVDTF